MELSERKRSRKSQSFKLVNHDYQDVYKGNENSTDVNGEHTLTSSSLGYQDVYKGNENSNNVNGEHTLALASFVGDEGLEIKKQITGMRRLLNDSTGRIYQRVGEEGENIKEALQDSDVAWGHTLSPSPETIQSVHPPQRAAWSSSSPMNLFSAQYGTRSKDNHNIMKTSKCSNGEIPQINALAGSNCCTCNCQPTLQAILEELKAIRKYMQLQAGAQIKPPTFSSVGASRSTLSRKRMKKRKLPLRIVPPTVAIQKPHLEKQRRHLRISEMPSLTTIQPNTKVENNTSRFGIVKESSASDPEVQLAEGFDVLMSKSQLDSILANYTRSGSLLFRKLVCAFFDDQTLANSLPNGKRKRGLNDNRKGLDHNIVGAIKVFTEKYCSANRIDKVPGPRDWVQILQDQIKLARRRLKRDTDSGNCSQSNTEEMWVAQNQECSM